MRGRGTLVSLFGGRSVASGPAERPEGVAAAARGP